MSNIDSPNDQSRLLLGKSYYNTKFESNAVRYKAGLLHLINNYPESELQFNDKTIHKMLLAVCSNRQKLRIRNRILQSFQRESKRVQEDIAKLRANKDAEILPLERICEMKQINYVVDIIMSKYILTLQKNNCKSPPLSIIEEILSELDSLNLKINKTKIEMAALVWLKKNIKINKAKKIKNTEANIPYNFNVASSETNIVPESQSLADEKFTEITDSTQDSEFNVSISDENELDNKFFPDEESLFSKNELMIDCEVIDECNSIIASGDIYSDTLNFFATTDFDYLQQSIDFLPNHTVTQASDIPASPRPELKILIQPSNRITFWDINDRSASYCSTLDQNEGSKFKKPPTVKLLNYCGNVFITCQLVTDDKHKRLPHAHKLAQKKIGQSFTVTKDFHEAQVSEDNEFTFEFPQMNIIQTPRIEFKEELFRKKQIEVIIQKLKKESSKILLNNSEVKELQKLAEEEAKTMNADRVALCFQAFYRDNEGVLRKLTDPIFSRSIINIESTNCESLKICRIQKRGGSCEGSDETFMVVSKLNPDSIRIKFYELDECGKEIWCDYGKFSKEDVYCQTTIVFRTPPYKDTNITSAKDVYVKLERISNGECSNSVRFTYEPNGNIPIEKRARMSSAQTELIVPNNQVDSICTENSTKYLCQTKPILFKNENNDISEVGSNFENGIEKSQSDDDSSFAADFLVKVLDVMKENPLDERNRIIDLLKEVTYRGDTPLHVALRYNQTQTIGSLVMILSLYPELKSIVNVRNNSGKTPLHLAVEGNLAMVVKALLVLGADPNCKDEDDCCPLDIAFTSPDRTDCVDVILSASRSSDIPKDKYLHLAAKIGSLDSLKLLIREGADVNSVDVNCGGTILHFAVENLNKDIIEYLIHETRIDINMNNFEGKTAFQIATTLKGFKAKEICVLLIRARLRLRLH